MPGTNSPELSHTEQKKPAKTCSRRAAVSRPHIVISLSLSPREMRLILAYRELSDATQGTLVDMAEAFTGLHSLQRTPTKANLRLVMIAGEAV